MIRGAIMTTAVAGAFFEAEPDLADYSYTKYIEQFGKTAESFREQIFNAKLDMMKVHNSEPEKTWVAGPNEFTDWTDEEFRTLRTRGLANGQFDVVTLTTGELSGLPARVDWREKAGVVTPVKNQASCGSCWAFSATETLESHYAIALNEPSPILSPQQIVDCAPNPNHCGGSGGCDGATQPIAFNYTATIGITTDSSYPYTATTNSCDQSKINPVAINSGFVSLKTNDYTQLVTAVATKGPVAISVDAGGIGWSWYHAGILSSDCGYDMDHAVQLVGYGAQDNVMYWLVRNSWGPHWGENGYIRIKRFGEGKEPCGMDNTPQHGDACAGDTTPRKYCGFCGILSSSSYPTNMRKATSIQI